MLVFIDESGDAGFKVDKGASPIFVAAMVMFHDVDDAQRTEKAIRGIAERLGHKTEFKFSKSSKKVRDSFFDAVRDLPFTVRAIVIRKEAIYSAHLKTDKEDFYRFFIRQMMTYDNGTLVNARVVIDGSGDREFRNMLRASLRRQVGDCLKDVRFGNSKNDMLVQLADMCVGAIARSYRPERDDRMRWRQKLLPRIGDVWDFL